MSITVEEMQENNAKYVPSKPYYLYVTVNGITYRAESAQYERAKKSKRLPPHSLSRMSSGRSYKEASDFYEKYLKNIVW